MVEVDGGFGFESGVVMKISDFALSAVLFLGASLHAGETVVLFDGKSLDQWEGAKGEAPGSGWVIEADGSLGRKEKTGDLLTKQVFKNFEMEWEWKIGEGGNSGVKYWVNKIGNQNLGIEYQLIDDERHADAKNGVKRQTGSIYDIKGAAADKMSKPAGEWNTSKLVVRGTTLEHWLNGKLAVAADTGSAEWKELFGQSKYVKYADQGFAPGHGKILLQDHGDPVWFRNIRLTKLDD
jgi:hypothetical protein